MKIRKPHRLGLRSTIAVAVGAVLAVATGVTMVSAARDQEAAVPTLPEMLASAADESQVPVDLLNAIAVVSTNGQSITPENGLGRTGPLLFPDSRAISPRSGQGDARTLSSDLAADSPATNVMRDAANLLRVPDEQISSDPATSVRAAAALLRDYAEENNAGQLPQDLRGWFVATATYLGAGDAMTGRPVATEVFRTLRSGRTTTLANGSVLTVDPNPEVESILASAPTGTGETAECPVDLDCKFVGAAYQQLRAGDNTHYGNFDLGRPADTPSQIILDQATPTAVATLAAMQDPSTGFSAHYIVTTAGEVVQTVQTEDTAWTAGSTDANARSITMLVESQPDGSFSPQAYSSTAALIRYVGQRFGVTPDRGHLLDASEIAQSSSGASPRRGLGDRFSWSTLMDEVGSSLPASGPADGSVVTIASLPDGVPATLHSEPIATSAVPQSGPLPGRAFAVVDRVANWTAITHAGERLWVSNDQLTSADLRTGRPAIGLADLPVFAQALPSSAEYPTTVEPKSAESIGVIPQGGSFPILGTVTGADFQPHFATTRAGSTIVDSATTYYVIPWGNSLAYVNAADVEQM